MCGGVQTHACLRRACSQSAAWTLRLLASSLSPTTVHPPCWLCPTCAQHGKALAYLAVELLGHNPQVMQTQLKMRQCCYATETLRHSPPSPVCRPRKSCSAPALVLPASGGTADPPPASAVPGLWAQKIQHPSGGVTKEYLVSCTGPVSRRQLQASMRVSM